MGAVIVLAERRADRSRLRERALPAFFFDLACPDSYLAAEQVERCLGEVEWLPVRGDGPRGRGAAPEAAADPGRETAIGVRFLDQGQGRDQGQGPDQGQGRDQGRGQGRDQGQGRDKGQGRDQGQRGCGDAWVEGVRARAEARAAKLRLPLVWPEDFPAPVPSALRAAAYAAECGAGQRFALAASRLAFCGGFDLEDPEILAEAAAAAAIPLDECLAAARDHARDAALQATARGLRSRGVSRLPALQLGTRWFEGHGAPAEAAELLRVRAAYGAPLAPGL